jgi:heptosyltransferase-3
LRHTLSLLVRIFRKYDLAISTSTTDRAFILLFFAARIRIGKIASMNRKTWWKRRMVNAFVQTDPDAHVLSENLRIADAIGIERQYVPIFPESPRHDVEESLNLPFEPDARSFVVIHMKPGTLVRQWPEGYWRALIGGLRSRGLAVVATGGNCPAERKYVADILSDSSDPAGLAPACSLAGKLPFHRVVELLRGAALFVGTDTSTTHLAAATGVPTVALFGPTDPVRWGPWPVGIEQDASPWNRREATQRVGNVTLLRACCSCASSKQECRLAPGMPGACMLHLSPETVLATVDGILERSHRLGRLG